VRESFVVYLRDAGLSLPGKLMPDILDLLQDREELRFAAGEVILEDGGSSTRLLFLCEGAVEVLKDGVQIATSSEPGTVFGVFSLLPDGRDMATVRALQPSVFRVVENPRDFLQQSPLVCWHVCETIAHRLAALSAYVSDVRRQFAGTDHLAMMSDVLATLLQRQPSKRIRPSESTRLQGEMMD
jgi:CRP/FNR family cyclic AMP-dependent transcriptional regulator